MKSHKSLNTSVRLGILLGLYYVKSAWFAQLLESTRLNKAELYQHLRVLEKEGYIKLEYIPTVRGKRLRASITQKGEEVAKEVLKLLNE
nr:transcriptional regulator [Acidianus sp. RZ1]